jgi:hypothetical protein
MGEHMVVLRDVVLQTTVLQHVVRKGNYLYMNKRKRTDG